MLAASEKNPHSIMTLKSDFGRSVSRFQLHVRTYYTLMKSLLSLGPLEAETLQISGFRRCTHGSWYRRLYESPPLSTLSACV